MATFEKVFQHTEGAFSANDAAVKWLDEKGYSVGSSCVGGPQAIKKGAFIIAKWKNLTASERLDIDGVLWAGRDEEARVQLKAAPDGVCRDCEKCASCK